MASTEALFLVNFVSPVVFLDSKQKAFQGCRMYLQLFNLEQKCFQSFISDCVFLVCLHNLPAPIRSTFLPKAPASEEGKFKIFALKEES